MSVVIVKASVLTVYQNRTTTEHSSGKVGDNSLSQFQATASEKPELQYSALNSLTPQIDNSTITNHIIRTNIIVGGIEAGAEGGKTEETFEKSAAAAAAATENMRAKLQQLLQRENDDDEDDDDVDGQKKQQQQQEQQYQQQLQQSQHAILSSENAYLLERIDGGMHEQPIYGTWSAKARRPQAPLLAATAAVAKQSSFVQPLMGEVDENYYENHNPNHHYERLPRRSSTMTPVRRELHDQIPRPPRLTSRQPSLAVRRQFTDTALTKGSQKDESRPKPFHFPFEGPMPEEFKKFQQQSEISGIRPGGGVGGERGGSIVVNDDVNNIQDILQKLNLGGGVSKMPPLMMMPSGLHISGSFKNLKSSGLGNFFRGKRNKKQMQMQFPMPIPMQMQMLNSYPQPLMNVMPQPYQQRIAMDQFFQYKPRSPNDINLLAMQQQQQKLQFKQSHSKGKKQKKRQKDKKNAIASSNLMLQQYPFTTPATDFFYPSLYPPFMTVNVTQAPTLAQLTKRVPFKVNLDIFPVMPPSKHHKTTAHHLAMDEARIVSSSRPPTALRNPFMDYFTTPIIPTVSALNYYNQYNPKQALYNPIRFPTGAAKQMTSMDQTTNMQMVYPEQMQKYLQQQHQHQQQHLYNNFLNTQGHQTPFLPIDCDQPLPSAASSIAATNSKTNPIMVHLNVFPKQKPSSPISTNPFYSNTPHIQRTSIQEESESSLNPIEPRNQARSLNDLSLNKIARSDTIEDTQQQAQQKRLQQQKQQQLDLVDFEHPIVAVNSEDQVGDEVDDNAELPQPSALQGSIPNISSESQSQSFYYDTRPNATLLHTLNNNTNYNMNFNSGTVEQMASDAKTASLFRFPVEDLIQFQVHDAM